MMSEQPTGQRRPSGRPVRSPEERAGLFRRLYENALLTWYLLWDERVGFWPKLIPLLALVYFISPIDLAPELLMGPLAPLGIVDDITLAIASLNLFVQASPPDVVREYLRKFSSDHDQAHRQDEDNVVDSTAEVIDE